MKEDTSLEYRIKRLERLIRNNHAVKNEAKIASVGRKMFAVLAITESAIAGAVILAPPQVISFSQVKYFPFNANHA